jgi:hypothetical protein
MWGNIWKVSGDRAIMGRYSENLDKSSGLHRSFCTNKIVARCTPKPYSWFGGLGWLFAFGFIAVVVREYLRELLGFNLQRSALIFAWLSVTAIFLAWSYTRTYRRLFCTLSDDALFVGRGPAATVVPFAEIESIVLGLPDHMAWWIRIDRFNPMGGYGYEYHAHAREVTML